TDQTMAARWAKRYLINLTSDYDDRTSKGGSNTLRSHADTNRNFTFYRSLIGGHGPLSIWWASSAMLNQVSGAAHKPRAWEGHLLALYRGKHGCLPLKNR